MDVNKNSYTFTFAAIMVVVVAAILSFAATSLKPFQDKNIDLESKQNILKSIGVEIERDQADEYFSKYIKQQLVVQDGKVVENPEVPALDINMAKEIKKDGAARTLPLYIAEKDGNTCFILPLRGKGLWGPVWGYISLESDGSTVIGANFDHEGETPGLGAEISKPIFMDQFPGKQIMKDGEFVSIEVRKGDASGDYQVDGISGGTITSVGVDDMLEDCIANYVAYLDKVSASAQEPVSIEKMEMEIDELMDSTATQQDSITAVALITE
jgi:Na+-transporting NADH:ubiquinone oxidoreductase subunit C